MRPRDAITPEQLARLHQSMVPTTVVDSPEGYAVVVSVGLTPLWLHGAGGQFRIWRDLDAVVEVLRRCGVRRFCVDLNGGVQE